MLYFNDITSINVPFIIGRTMINVLSRSFLNYGNLYHHLSFVHLKYIKVTNNQGGLYSIKVLANNIFYEI